ncbi:MAG: hypothetical protein J2P17_11485, partial [Mycobacterium sp.]|nr:hypothetical protein [Mycobacterium sp.]
DVDGDAADCPCTFPADTGFVEVGEWRGRPGMVAPLRRVTAAYDPQPEISVYIYATEDARGALEWDNVINIGNLPTALTPDQADDLADWLQLAAAAAREARR